MVGRMRCRQRFNRRPKGRILGRLAARISIVGWGLSASKARMKRCVATKIARRITLAAKKTTMGERLANATKADNAFVFSLTPKKAHCAGRGCTMIATEHAQNPCTATL